MKLHDLRPAPGSHTRKTRVGRGIAAGKGKTAGRGTKGQKARAGGSIPPWFEGGQTPLHMRIPKLRGFENRFKVYYEVVNVGSIAAAAERGAFESGDLPGTAKGKKAAPLTVNQDVLRAVGLVRTMTKPLKILGAGELDVPLFVVADAFTKSAREKIEAAGGTVSVLETPATATKALGVDGEVRAPREARTAAGRKAAEREVDARAAREQATADAAEEAEAASAAKAAKPAKSPKASRTDAAAPATATDEAEPAAASDEATTDATATDEAATAEAADAGDEAGPTSDAGDTEAAEADATDDDENA
ncbi:MAG TPA: 50S ribosomal protein L15 [Candidatus Limnocylindrales bacterium]|jgi:large subunit ribosomal protein L15